jgi:hypothetical protein
LLLEAAVFLAACGSPLGGSWTHEGSGRFVKVASRCVLRTRGGPGVLWRDRRPRRPYELRVVWRTVGDSNSGVFIGPYEVQIDATDVPDATTGAIYKLAAPDVAKRDRALRAGWNTFRIGVRGRRITVRLNDVLITRFAAPRPVSGRIGLQNHGDADTVEFRSVQVR